MPQHLQMTHITVKMVCNNGGSSLQITLTQCSLLQPPSITRLHDLQLTKTKNCLDALQCLCLLGGIIKHIQTLVMVPKNLLISFTDEAA